MSFLLILYYYKQANQNPDLPSVFIPFLFKFYEDHEAEIQEYFKSLQESQAEDIIKSEKKRDVKAGLKVAEENYELPPDSSSLAN